MTSGEKIQWTDQQQKAIATLGANVLVTASAGTGKTAVLSGRAVNLVSDAALCPNVLNILVLTFTEAAAEQMRSRIGRRLKDTFEQTRDWRLGKQLVLLQGADISTIHAFCKRLISENFHEVALDPAFRVIDADEAMLLKAEVLEETIDWAWGQEHLVPALESLLRRRDVRDSGGFLSSVIRLHEFLDGVASRDQWCERARLVTEATDPELSELGQAQKQIVGEALDAIVTRLHAALRLYEGEDPGGKWGTSLQADVIAPIEACRDRLKAGDWQTCVDAIRCFDKPRAPALRGFPETLGGLIKDLRTRAISDFVSLDDLAIINPDYMDAVGRSANMQSRVLIDLVQKFDSLYAQRKKALSGLDFADLEHYALRLLTTQDDSSGGAVPSETALGLRDRYKYIFVDEYQDINPVQQAILDALSSGDNVFVVGDVKQSIYAWRGAEPTIFLQRLQTSGEMDGAPYGFRVDLNTNFRSAAGLLHFVNKVFGRIMTASLANIDYDETARLRPGPDAEAQAKSTGGQTPLVELHILDEKADDTGDAHPQDGDEADADGADAARPRQRQAALIAQRIQQIVGAEPGLPAMKIFDKDAGGLRKVEYRDIVVLMRSLAKKANDYVEVLRLAGIPVSCDATAGYFETTEISDVLCLLKVLDNPQRDIELAAVLRSPFFRFTDSELASIRIASRDKSLPVNFYAAASRYRETGSDAELVEKLRDAFATLDRWRRLARRGQLADLLWRIYRETQYVAFVCALPNGQARKANLLKLHDRAIQFEGFASSAGVPSLTRFVAFIEKLQEAGQDWTPAEPAGAAGDAVRIISVHKSKGLEFPVVFLAELDGEFNQRDSQNDLVADTDHTLGLRIIDAQTNTKLRSLAHQVIGEKKRAVTLAEEMRVLYVAMTRAKDRLIVTASQKRTDCGKVLTQGLLLGDPAVPAWLLKNSKSPLEWLLYGLADQRALHQAFGTGLTQDASDEGLFDLRVYGAEELREFSRRVQELRDRKKRPAVTPKAGHGGSQGRKLLAELKRRLDWQYAFSKAVHEPAKRSVTALTHHDDEFARLDYSRALDRQPLSLIASDASGTIPGAARQIGTATHLVISNIDLSHSVTRQSIGKTLDELVSEEAIVSDVAEKIDIDAIAAFFESPLGALVLDEDNAVLREWPFTYGLPASELTESDGVTLQRDDAKSEGADEIIVVQGIIDMLVRTPEGLVVIDFKSDRVAGAQIADRAETYRGQLDLYGRAASGILQCPVHQKWLYFLAPRVPLAVET